jgi:hypothetical protein
MPPSNETNRKYGQQLVLQEQKRKYDAQQAGYDRMFTLGRDAMQSRNQAIMQGQQNAANTIRDATRFANDQTAQEQQNKFARDQQRAQDFAAARGRMDAYAKDALNNPDLPHELRQKIQNLISGKMTALGGGFDGPAQQEFLDQYNAQLAGLLSEVPPPKPKAPPQPNFHTDQNGNQWVEEGPEKWSQVPQTEKPPTSAAEAFQADPKVEARYMEEAKAIEVGDGELTPDNRKKARARAQQLWEEDNSPTAPNQQWGGSGIQASTMPLPQPAMPGTERSILEQPAAIPVAPPDAGIPPSPPMPTIPGQQMEPVSLTANPSSQNPGTEPTQATPSAPTPQSPQPSQGSITPESASMAAKQYETTARSFQELQAKADAIEGQIRGVSGKGGRSGVLSSNNNNTLTELKKERDRVKAEMQTAQQSMQQADKTARSYYDQEIAKQPAAQNLAKAGKRPQDFAEAEFQLQSLRKQYPDMASMPAEAKKKLKEAMAVIQAGR